MGIDDDLSHLFDYDPNLDETGSSSNIPIFQGFDSLSNDDFGLGIDEAVSVNSKRILTPQVVEDILLSDNGIPRLQQIIERKFKIEGKGYEVGTPSGQSTFGQFQCLPSTPSFQ